MNRFSLATPLIAVLAIGAACTASKPQSVGKDAEMREVAQPSEAQGAISTSNQNFLEAYRTGAMTEAASHYAENGQWFLTNGTAISGRGAIAAFLSEAKESGASNFHFDGRVVAAAGEAQYSWESFGFNFSPEVAVSGQRYGVWAAGPSLAVDAWVPDTAADAALSAEISTATTALAAAYNTPDPENLAARYTADPTVVLSNGTVFRTAGAVEMLRDTAGMGITDMRFGPQRVFAAGEAAYAIGSFNVTLPLPNGPVPLSGERLTLWKRGPSGWRVALEMSWPAEAAKVAVLRAGGAEFAWRFEGERLVGRVSAPTTGWVAVGFNDRAELAGSRLIMARVVDGRPEAEEHWANPPNHAAIDAATVSAERVATADYTDVEFVLDPAAVAPSNLALRPGQQVWVTLAFSQSSDFQHHSTFRTLLETTL